MTSTTSSPAASLIFRGVSLVAICFTMLGIGGCNVGKGVGAARGKLFELGCSKSGDYGCVSENVCGDADASSCAPKKVCGTLELPMAFDLLPTFFVGEPIDDLREYSPGSEIMSNRLIIRLQRSGKQVEQNDVLTFDVVNLWEVARCVRGALKKDGTGDWDPTNCYRASDSETGRIRVSYDSVVHSALALKATCSANLVASAISAPIPLEYSTTPPPVVLDGSWSSWVEFQDFGSAAQTSKLPKDRDEVDKKFRIELGERLHATSFMLTLTDDNIVDAAIHDLPRPDPQVGGILGGDATTGRFDFDLERGQGAQSFP